MEKGMLFNAGRRADWNIRYENPQEAVISTLSPLGIFSKTLNLTTEMLSHLYSLVLYSLLNG